MIAMLGPEQDYQWFPLTQEGHFDHDVYDISEAIKNIDATVDENYQAIPVVSINHGSVLPSAPLPQCFVFINVFLIFFECLIF